MGLRLDWVTFDAADPRGLAEFWAAALDYEILSKEGDTQILVAARDGSPRRMLFEPVGDEKRGKNRLHLDLRPDDQEAEVRRLEELGAQRVDVGQGEVTWVVMADPEGNEFCVLRALRDDERGRVPFGD